MPILNPSFEHTIISSTALFPVGMTMIRFNSTTQCEETWIYVKNDEAATATAVGSVCLQDVAAANGNVLLSTNPGSEPLGIKPKGVAQFAITAQYYGWIMQKGFAEVLGGSAGFTAATALVPDGAAAGGAEDMVAGEEHRVFGHAIDTTAAAATGTAWINCLG